MITDRHKAFAQAVARAAREHGMRKYAMQITFEAGFNQPQGYRAIEAHWTEGRHGSESSIEIKLREQVTIEEATSAHPHGPIQTPNWCSYPNADHYKFGCHSLTSGKIRKPQDCDKCEYAGWNRRAGDML